MKRYRVIALSVGGSKRVFKSQDIVKETDFPADHADALVKDGHLERLSKKDEADLNKADATAKAEAAKTSKELAEKSGADELAKADRDKKMSDAKNHLAVVKGEKATFLSNKTKADGDLLDAELKASDLLTAFNLSDTANNDADEAVVNAGTALDSAKDAHESADAASKPAMKESEKQAKEANTAAVSAAKGSLKALDVSKKALDTANGKVDALKDLATKAHDADLAASEALDKAKDAIIELTA